MLNTYTKKSLEYKNNHNCKNIEYFNNSYKKNLNNNNKKMIIKNIIRKNITF